jgi:hypothetical protein
MIVRLQHDFLNTLRQQQQAEDDDYSDDEVRTQRLEPCWNLLTLHCRVTMSFPHSDESQLKVLFEVFWALNTTGEVGLLWRLRDCSTRCTNGTYLLANMSSTTRNLLLKTLDHSPPSILLLEKQRMLNEK